jgi:hypothetical protein
MQREHYRMLLVRQECRYLLYPATNLIQRYCEQAGMD